MNINVYKKTSIQEKIANLKDAKNNQVIVVSHRGDWRNAPENSLQAILRNYHERLPIKILLCMCPIFQEEIF